MFMPFHALWVEDAISYLPIALTLSVAIWVCSFIKAAAITATLALLMVLLVLVVPPGFTSVFFLDCR